MKFDANSVRLAGAVTLAMFVGVFPAAAVADHSTLHLDTSGALDGTAEIGDITVRASDGATSGSATTGSSGGAKATASSGDTSVTTTLGCVTAEGTAADQSSRATLGSCPDKAVVKPTTKVTAPDEASVGAELPCVDAGVAAAESNRSSLKVGCAEEKDAARVDAIVLDRALTIRFSCLVGMSMAKDIETRVTLDWCPKDDAGGAANVKLEGNDAAVSAGVGCTSGSATSSVLAGGAHAGSCAGGSDQPAAAVGAASGDTSASGSVGCVDASAGSGLVLARAGVGDCADDGGPGAGGAGGRTPKGEGEGGGDGSGTGQGVAGTATGARETTEDEDRFAILASGELPFTGLALWLVLLAGLIGIIGGVLLVRRRPENDAA
ncbi:MAG: hypothetical protein M3303_14000 [Gemmatimonadota bacterium]|nr:hypothetical protein [Gemmatimonadota bacterium]